MCRGSGLSWLKDNTPIPFLLSRGSWEKGRTACGLFLFISIRKKGVFNSPSTKKAMGKKARHDRYQLWSTASKTINCKYFLFAVLWLLEYTFVNVFQSLYTPLHLTKLHKLYINIHCIKLSSVIYLHFATFDNTKLAELSCSHHPGGGQPVRPPVGWRPSTGFIGKTVFKTKFLYFWKKTIMIPNLLWCCLCAGGTNRSTWTTTRTMWCGPWASEVTLG